MMKEFLDFNENIEMRKMKNPENHMGFQLSELSDNPEITDAALEVRVEAAAYSASKFFGLPEAKIIKGDCIGVYKNGEGVLSDDVFEYNLEQFKQNDCTSFEDMTKIWAHECGHRLFQNILPNSWADELGADFFAGARSEMLGLSKSNFEKFLKSTQASETHPDGNLRIQAMDYGRYVVSEMKKNGIQPTWENCIEAYMESPFAKMVYDATGKSVAAFIDNKAYHLGNAERAKDRIQWNQKKVKESIAKNDFKKAKEYAESAKRNEKDLNDAIRAAKRSTK